jgi:hypothetical protein
MELRAISPSSSSSLKRTWLARAAVALMATSAFTIAPHAEARVFISVNIAPPLLPVYEQPPLPGPGYLWTPGYWAYADGGYYWVPGTWVRAPYRGALWTPGYWGWGGNGAYVFHGGYWGLHVGYYGGINYGYGYTGSGYYGGYWNRGGFYYNRAANRFGGVRITNIYNRTVINNTVVNRYSFNGPGGINRQPTRQELAFAHERHMGPVSAQVQQRVLASRTESLRASVNHGNPPIAATPRAGEFTRKGAAVGPDAMNRGKEPSHGDKAESKRGSNKDKGSTQGPSTNHGQRAKSAVKGHSTRQSHEPNAHASAQGKRSEDKHETMTKHSAGPRENAGMRAAQAPRQEHGGNKKDDHKHGK